ncbi:SdpI family protein [Flavobacterium sp. J49]|uniref:SdpI family protein n=1 Tax=Flavobacterium sp. J49 TaxID=2718534 RepID=UPI00159329BE|nr:SdpI family protein [Flavobacterium sp. J49]MBF6641452.1 SdpI family protein [Flavobacterium sp. J49]NIC02699.1 SdpI family protein [Flavobacterium sp. J49]
MEETLIYFIENTLFISFLVGFIFLITALITLKFPPKKINYLYGYRTTASMKNQEVWDFAQRYSGIKMIQAGLFLMLISFVNVFLNPQDEFLQIVFGIVFITAAVIYLFISTEKAIRKNFPNV